MNDFVNLIIGKLQGAMSLAVIAVIVCSISLGVIFVFYRAGCKKPRNVPFNKIVLILILVGYLAALFYITVLRTDMSGGVNFHLFRAWREAWNNFSFKNWSNILLNILMFVPLGMMLPLLSKLFRKWYVVPGIGFLTSLAIEVIQLLANNGLFDVDDLFANTTGVVFGYCLVMLIVSICIKGERNRFRAVAYASVPLLITLAISGIFLTYHIQDYGNIRNAAAYRVSTNGVEWNLNCALSGDAKKAPIYKVETFDKESCDEFGIAFLRRLGVTGDIDISYYDWETYFMDHREHTLIVSRLDQSYEYRYDPTGERSPAQTARSTIESLLSKYTVKIPENASFRYEGEGWHCFEVLPDTDSHESVGGTLRCRYSSEGILYCIQNRLASYAYCADETILSEEDAFKQVKKGRFSSSYFEAMSPRKVTVVACDLTYEVDTKGYVQPVYAFSVEVDEAENDIQINTIQIMIPALKMGI